MNSRLFLDHILNWYNVKHVINQIQSIMTVHLIEMLKWICQSTNDKKCIIHTHNNPPGRPCPVSRVSWHFPTESHSKSTWPSRFDRYTNFIKVSNWVLSLVINFCDLCNVLQTKKYWHNIMIITSSMIYKPALEI